jgi:outer membrane receptor protein involved in Fe transport
VLWTVGLSHDDYGEDSLKVDGLSPKLGMQWDITRNLRLRAASFRSVKPALVSNRTIEPTQVAGFTQLFDDVNASESNLDAIAVDWRASANLSFGAELTRRKVDVPVFINAGSELQREEEELHRVYANWTPTERFALTAEAVYDQFEGRQGSLTTFGVIPQTLLTRRVPVALRYFHPNGFFAGIGADHVRHTVRRSGPLAPPDGDDEFVIVNFTAGYRLPNRRGTISLEVRNLRDAEFSYQDDSFREFGDEPTTGPYIPERTLVLRLSTGF